MLFITQCILNVLKLPGRLVVENFIVILIVVIEFLVTVNTFVVSVMSLIYAITAFLTLLLSFYPEIPG